jgi:hypothetical protein
MNHAQLENWVNEIVAAFKSGKSSEDDRLEMKTEWPTDFAKTSRQLAGHANAARGGQILWIIGLNQRAGTVTGADELELANWYPQLSAMFEGSLAPSVQTLAVPVEGGLRVVAMLFETDRAPYIVKTENRQCEWEIPWREGTHAK